MGYYLERTIQKNGLPTINKAKALINECGAKVITNINEFEFDFDNPKGAIVCVVENAWFDAAAFAYSQNELDQFKESEYDKRARTWLYIEDRDWVLTETEFKD